MTHSGPIGLYAMILNSEVLIPLLLDDPLWAYSKAVHRLERMVLIPLLLDDPLWVELENAHNHLTSLVLIPLLLDDPLWVVHGECYPCTHVGLNPSFAG